VAARSKAWIVFARTLGSWVRISFKAWMSVCVYSVSVLFCVEVAALWRTDPPSKESYRLCIGLRNWKSVQGHTKGLQSHNIKIVWILHKTEEDGETTGNLNTCVNTPAGRGNQLIHLSDSRNCCFSLGTDGGILQEDEHQSAETGSLTQFLHYFTLRHNFLTTRDKGRFLQQEGIMLNDVTE
jgi:hypothetical protein